MLLCNLCFWKSTKRTVPKPEPEDESMSITVEKLAEWKQEAMDFFAEWREEARYAYDFVAGRQYTAEEVSYLHENDRPVIVFNRVAPVIKSVLGYQINNRQEVTYSPREPMDQGVVDIANATSRYYDSLCSAHRQTSLALRDALLTGIGWTEMYMDYSQDPQGRLVTAERVDPLKIVYDPHTSRSDFGDCRFIMRVKKYCRDEAERLWPKVADLGAGDNDELQSGGMDVVTRIKYSGDSWPDKNFSDNVWVTQAQYWEHEDYYRTAAPSGQGTADLSASDFKKIKKQLDEAGVPYVKFTKKVYYQTFFCGGIELSPPRIAPCAEGFSFTPITSERDETEGQFYGMIRDMKDPQRWANKFFSDIQEFVSNNKGGGAFAETDAFLDPLKAETQWAQSDQLILLNPGALGQGKIRERQPVSYPAGLQNMLTFAISALPDVSGVNLEMMGAVDRMQPGVTEMQRKQAGLTILAPVFDSLHEYYLRKGWLTLHFIREYLNDGRLVRLIGERDEQFVPLIFDKSAEVFDINVDSAPTSPDMKAQTFAAMSQLLPQLQASGIPVSDDIIDYLPLPAALTTKWRKQLDEMKSQPPPPDPEIQKLQAKMEIEQQRMQLDQAKMQQDAQLKTMQMQKEYEIRTADQQVRFEIEKQRQMLNMQLKGKELELQGQELLLKQQELEIDAEKSQAGIELGNAKLQLQREIEQMRQDQARLEAMSEELKAEDREEGAELKEGLNELASQMGTLMGGMEKMFKNFNTVLDEINGKIDKAEAEGQKEQTIERDAAGKIIRIGDRKILRDAGGNMTKIVPTGGG